MRDRVRREMLEQLPVPLSQADARALRRRQRLRLWMWELSLGLLALVKRLIDIAIAGTALLLFSPLFAIVALWIYIEDPGPIFYVQDRVGLNGRVFRFIKFRSMVTNAAALKDKLLQANESEDGVTFKMKNDPRVTRIGRFIRRFSVDELPQILNVLLGDMAIVGPRPPVPREVAEYTLEERKRLHVKPGLTCIWQVSGRSDIPFKQQVQLDLQYIRSRSILTDFWIILKTVPAVLLGRGAY